MSDLASSLLPLVDGNESGLAAEAVKASAELLELRSNAGIAVKVVVDRRR